MSRNFCPGISRIREPEGGSAPNSVREFGKRSVGCPGIQMTGVREAGISVPPMLDVQHWRRCHLHSNEKRPGFITVVPRIEITFLAVLHATKSREDPLETRWSRSSLKSHSYTPPSSDRFFLSAPRSRFTILRLCSVLIKAGRAERTSPTKEARKRQLAGLILVNLTYRIAATELQRHTATTHSVAQTPRLISNYAQSRRIQAIRWQRCSVGA